MLVKWLGSDAAWVAAGNISSGSTTTDRPFRCAGANYQTGTHPNAIAGEFVGPSSGYKGEDADTATADWVTAHDACFDRGGHLPRSAELAELIQQGLPNGTSTWLWTSDQLAYDGTDFRAARLRWTDTDTRFSYRYTTSSDSMTWIRKTSTAPFRCIYYPIDTGYSGPTAAQCSGTCFEVTLPGATPARMWLDEFDRVPATLEAAFADCASDGGHLASERDLTEAIRHGLPNGTDTRLHTSDFALGTSTSGVRQMVVSWVGTDTMYDDQWSTYMTWGKLDQVNPYRCFWSNEIR